MAEIRHLENRHDIFAVSGPIWIKFRRLVQNDMPTATIWTKSKIEVEFQYSGRLSEFNDMSFQSHVSHCRVLPPGEFNVMIPEPHWKSFFALFFVFLMQFGLRRAAAFVSSLIHLSLLCVFWYLGGGAVDCREMLHDGRASYVPDVSSALLGAVYPQRLQNKGNFWPIGKPFDREYLENVRSHSTLTRDRPIDIATMSV